MTEQQFRELLRTNRYLAVTALMQHKVDEWMNDGPAEVVRCLTCWAAAGIDLGDDDDLIELAEGLWLEEEFEGDDLCDQCMRSGVQVARTNAAGKTICVDCDETYEEEE